VVFNVKKLGKIIYAAFSGLLFVLLLSHQTVTKSKGAEIDYEDDNSVFYGALYMGLGLGFFTGFWGVIRSITTSCYWTDWYTTHL